MDLARHHEPIAGELHAAFERVLGASGFVLGSEVAEFEREFADFCGVQHCVGVNSGTAALTLALLAAGVGEGDEVIVPAHTYIASALAVMHAGALPVFCDVEEESGLIDVDSAARLIGPHTAAIVAVHLYGQPCEMAQLEGLVRRHGLLLVEDAAQAHGARYRGRRAGSLGDVAAFSFYPSKNLGALGDGGAICTDDDEIAARAGRLRDLGQRAKGEHLEAGFNERLDGIQAAMLRVKLKSLERWNASRREAAARYLECLPEDCRPLREQPERECVYHLFPVRLADRDSVRQTLSERGIATGVHYWPAVHRQPPMASLPSAAGALDSALRWSEEELSLPIFPELSEPELDAAIAALGEVLAEAEA
ncbi:MAG TPA: DegT/DnrJ/EryC1/StrS family aminotransferase [Solirubrobacterales bacterium]|nr:DegT/DnrJ/EryC1/StrS family aminotransferase [Solirubrobacterales bacterium]